MERGWHGGLKVAFFSAENPIMLLLAGIVVFLVLRVALSKVLENTKMGKRYADFVSALIILVGILMVTSVEFLGWISNALPYLGLVFVFVALGLLIFIGMGVKETKLIAGLKNFGGNTYLWIIVVLIVVWAASMIWGQSLLDEDRSTPLTGLAASQPIQEDETNDLTFIFAKPLLGFMLLFAVLGLAFFTVTRNAS